MKKVFYLVTVLALGLTACDKNGIQTAGERQVRDSEDVNNSVTVPARAPSTASNRALGMLSPRAKTSMVNPTRNETASRMMSIPRSSIGVFSAGKSPLSRYPFRERIIPTAVKELRGVYLIKPWRIFGRKVFLLFIFLPTTPAFMNAMDGSSCVWPRETANRTCPGCTFIIRPGAIHIPNNVQTTTAWLPTMESFPKLCGL